MNSDHVNDINIKRLQVIVVSYAILHQKKLCFRFFLVEDSLLRHESSPRDTVPSFPLSRMFVPRLVYRGRIHIKMTQCLCSYFVATNVLYQILDAM